jgi:hypothetical protein
MDLRNDNGVTAMKKEEIEKVELTKVLDERKFYYTRVPKQRV